MRHVRCFSLQVAPDRGCGWGPVACYAVRRRSPMSQLPAGRPAPWRYRPLLRSLGSYLNLQGARYLELEVQRGGFVWQFAPGGGRSRREHGTSSAEELLALDASYGQT